MKQEQEENRRKFIVPGGANYCYRAANCVFISSSNSVRHELAKALGGYMVRKFGDVKFSDRLVCLLQDLEGEVGVLFKGWPKVTDAFITESVPKSDKSRRVDLIRLSDCQFYEFETQKGVNKSGCVTIYL